MRWIPDLVRSYPKPVTLLAEWASSVRAREGGVVALGLGGPEAGHPATTFKKILSWLGRRSFQPIHTLARATGQRTFGLLSSPCGQYVLVTESELLRTRSL